MGDAERNPDLSGLGEDTPDDNEAIANTQVGIVFFQDVANSTSDNEPDTITGVLHVVNEMPPLAGMDGRVYNVRLLLAPRAGLHPVTTTQREAEQRKAPASVLPDTDTSPAPLQPLAANFHLNDRTGQIHRESQVSASRTNEKILASAQWLEANCERLISVADAARAVAMSKRNFLRRFREEMGMTPSEYLLCVRLNRTCRLLKESDLPIDKIARRSGMGSGARLAKVFRKRLNMSPTAFRVQARVETA
jgi:AraC-like DNA-binding protein